MGKIFEKASDHSVKVDDKLADIASQNSVAWEDIAQFNWATTNPREVLRALCEQIGTAQARAIELDSDPSILPLNPNFGPKDAKPIRIPKVWTPASLDVQKKYVLKIQQHTPASAVGIRIVDKWFMPDDESCDIKYVLDGDPGSADVVDFEVYASNYAELTDWNNGMPKFALLPVVPVYTEKLSGGNVAPKSNPTLTSWKGATNCGKGALSGDKRTINVAFSPYTVLLRYRKNGGDGAEARIDLDPFWPAFDSGKVLPASCKITWHVQKATKLKFGLLQILNGKGEVVFMKGLGEGEIATGKFDWDGNYSNGTPATADQMPYRALIEAHRGMDEPNGLALAAAHTEVRLFVDPRTLPLTAQPYDFSQDRLSLDLSLADLYHKDTKLTDSDGKLWTKFKLAEAGFHPGPVTDASNTDELKSAIREFKRSVPSGVPGNYTRMAIDENDDDPMKNALAGLNSKRRRPWFGKPDDQADWDPGTEADAIKTALRDFSSQMIVWIDDRNWYSDGIYWEHPDWAAALGGMSAATRAFLNNDHANMSGAPRGSIEDRDDRTACDARDIARPWIPLQADFRILRKGQTLTDTSDAVPEETSGKSRKAIGPIRVDWSFDEIEETETVGTLGELPKLDPVIETTLTQLYVTAQSRNRTRGALRWLLNNLMRQHDRVDIKKVCKYYNAPEDYGGIRPVPLATYFSKPFGIDVKSLYPWTARESSRQTVMCAVHDDVGQARDQLFPKRQGRAGVYFHPSLIGGDGYQVRAQVYFDKDGDYQFPNADSLKARYPKLAQAHSAKFRLWRKTSIRGYVCWGPDNSWNQASYNPHGTFPDSGPRGFRKYFTACHLHIVNELDEPDNALVFAPTGLFPDLAAYQQMVLNSLDPNDHGPRSQPHNITLSNAYVWPWSGHSTLGFDRSPANANPDAWFGALSSRQLLPVFLNFTTRISLEIVKAIEKQKGWMRGHVIVQFQVSPWTFQVKYRCTACPAQYVYVQGTDTQLPGQLCNHGGCTAPLVRDADFYFIGHYRCATCGFQWFCTDDTENPQFAGRECAHCGGALQFLQNNALYWCSNRHPFPSLPGQHGNACPCGGVLSGNVHLCDSNHFIPMPPGVNATGQPSPDGHGNLFQIPIIPGPRFELRLGKPLLGYVGDVPAVGLQTTSAGFPAGVSWDVNGDTDLWAHELAHNRYYEHAGGSAARPAGDLNLTHDSVDNLAAWPNPGDHIYAGGTVAGGRNFNRTWDRACLMSYITDVVITNPDAGSYAEVFDTNRDRPCFCYKCVLKNRGWKLGQSAYQPPPVAATIPPALPTPPEVLTD